MDKPTFSSNVYRAVDHGDWQSTFRGSGSDSTVFQRRFADASAEFTPSSPVLAPSGGRATDAAMALQATVEHMAGGSAAHDLLATREAELRNQARAVARAELADEAAALRADTAQLAQRLDDARLEVEGARVEALRRASSDVAALVLGLARRVVGDSLALHPDALPNLLRDTLAQSADEDVVAIRVPEADVARIREVVEPGLAERVVPDPDLAAGCAVDLHHAGIEATLDTVMVALDAAVQAWLATR